MLAITRHMLGATKLNPAVSNTLVLVDPTSPDGGGGGTRAPTWYPTVSPGGRTPTPPKVPQPGRPRPPITWPPLDTRTPDAPRTPVWTPPAPQGSPNSPAPQTAADAAVSIATGGGGGVPVAQGGGGGSSTPVATEPSATVYATPDATTRPWWVWVAGAAVLTAVGSYLISR